METAALMRTGSGCRFKLPSPNPAEQYHGCHHHHRGLPPLHRTRSAGAAVFSSRSPTTFHARLEMGDSNSRRHQSNTPHKHMRGVPVPNTLRLAASYDADPVSLFLSSGSVSPAFSATRSFRGGIGRSSSGPAKSALVEEAELDLSGAGAGSGTRVAGGGWHGGGSGDRQSGMGTYYKDMLQADPENPLLLINYGKYLQEVEGDVQGAEDCFARAVLASPGDGEALSLYANLMWEAHRDEDRAEAYFQRAAQAAPEDCYVLGSYAHFLWDADEEDADNNSNNTESATSAAISASSTPAAEAGIADIYG